MVPLVVEKQRMKLQGVKKMLEVDFKITCVLFEGKVAGKELPRMFRIW